MEWFSAVKLVRPHVFRISTPRGSGTGFLVSLSQKTGLMAIATAAHVVDSAHYWEEPIRIDHVDKGGSRLLRKDDRVILVDQAKDSAVIVVQRAGLIVPSSTLQLAKEGTHLKVGNEIGWLGFPAIPGAALCFFGGTTSAWLKEQSAYLVDGVAINGVSGGPAFYIKTKGGKHVVLIGLVSAYAPNRATGETLPGLSIIRDVSQFHDITRTFASFDQAKTEESPAELPAIKETPPSPSGTPTKRAT